jgi:hypothetical protein
MNAEHKRSPTMSSEATNSSESFGQFGNRGMPIYVARWIRLGEWVLFALLAVYLSGRILPNAWRKLNTDFPDYYLTAQLTREGNNISQAYEWVWLQRQKDHRNIDQRIVGLGVITPFSTLIIWPLTSMPPLTAKQFWLSLNLGFILGVMLLVRSLTRISWRRIALITFLSEPLQKNLIYGQYYVLLLFVLTLAFWCYVRQKRFFSGLLIGLGFGLKLFPLIYLIYFLRKKDWNAFAAGVIGSTSAAVVSVAVFGTQLNRVFIGQVLPWALRGEGMDPYNVSTNSIATLLHRLCIPCALDVLSAASLGTDDIVCACSVVCRTRQYKTAATQPGVVGDASRQSSHIDITSELSFHSSDSSGLPHVGGGPGQVWFHRVHRIADSLPSYRVFRVECDRCCKWISFGQRTSSLFDDLVMFFQLCTAGGPAAQLSI